MTQKEAEQMRAEMATLQLLLEVNETTAMEQAERAETALEELRKQIAESELQAQLVREVVGASTDSVLVVDAEWRVRYLNQQAKRELRVGDELLGRDLLEAIPEVLEPGFAERYRRVMEERRPETFEALHTGRGRWFSVSVSPVGEGIGIFLRDTSERRRQEAAIAKTEKLAAVGRLASSISHEINNPLESVTNLLYLIEHSASAGEEMRTYAALASSELARVSHIVTQTLKFHRQSTHATACRVSEIMESVVSLFRARLATRQVLLHRRYDDRDSMVCFAGDLRQVFANMIGNSMDAIGPGGQIWLRTRPSQDWVTGRTGLRVCVADNGCGMSPETRQSVFEAFFTTKPTTGTGLGLWVSEEIIRNHRGVVRLRSSERRGRSGTVFSIFFPHTD